MIFKFIDRKLQRFDFDRERVKKATYAVIIALSLLALILGIACAVLFLQVERLTVEAGSTVSAEMLTGDGEAYFGADFDPECVNHAGVYYFTVFTGGKERQVRLEVVDTKSPQIEPRRVYWPIGSTREPIPEDFIGSISEASEFSGYFVEELPEFKGMGEYSAKVRFVDAHGNKTQVFEVYLELVLDNEAPAVDLLTDSITVALGYDPSEEERSIYDGIATVKDNCAGETRYEIDDSDVNYAKKGRYTAYVYGYDMIGNRSDKVAVAVEVVDKAE